MTVDESQLFDGLVSQSMFTTFDLSDAMLAGDTAQVAKILQQLRASEEPESGVMDDSQRHAQYFKLAIRGKLSKPRHLAKQATAVW